MFQAFTDELIKIAAKVPFIHGTNGSWRELIPGIGETILKNDPNPRAVYTAMSNRNKLPGIERFAREAENRRGGVATVLKGKMDTKAGWRPNNLTPWGQKNIGSLEDAHALVDELDAGAAGARRGEIWRSLHKGTGSWANKNQESSLKVTSHKPVDRPTTKLKLTG